MVTSSGGQPGCTWLMLSDRDWIGLMASGPVGVTAPFFEMGTTASKHTAVYCRVSTLSQDHASHADLQRVGF